MRGFWDKVAGCSHKRISPNYLECWPCDTPYCECVESHCLDCGVYIIECGCLYSSGKSGWPEKRNRVVRRKRYRQSIDRAFPAPSPRKPSDAL